MMQQNPGGGPNIVVFPFKVKVYCEVVNQHRVATLVEEIEVYLIIIIIILIFSSY